MMFFMWQDDTTVVTGFIDACLAKVHLGQGRRNAFMCWLSCGKMISLVLPSLSMLAYVR